VIIDFIIGISGTAIGGFAVGYGTRALVEDVHRNRMLRCVGCGRHLKDCNDPITHGISR
jgi:hypothetical protein